MSVYRDYKAIIEAEEREEALRDAECERKYNIHERNKTSMLRSLRTATAHDYADWLRGFLSNGGKITHYYNYLLRDNMYVAWKDLTVYPLFGAQALDIIVPAHIEVTCDIEEHTHCKLFFMKDFSLSCLSFVPIYEDVARILG